MATLIKHNARKHSAGGPVSIGWGNLSMPGLATRRHVILTIGDYTLRVEEEDAKRLAQDVLNVIETHRHER